MKPALNALEQDLKHAAASAFCVTRDAFREFSNNQHSHI